MIWVIVIDSMILKIEWIASIHLYNSTVMSVCAIFLPCKSGCISIPCTEYLSAKIGSKRGRTRELSSAIGPEWTFDFFFIIFPLNLRVQLIKSLTLSCCMTLQWRGLLWLRRVSTCVYSRVPAGHMPRPRSRAARFRAPPHWGKAFPVDRRLCFSFLFFFLPLFFFSWLRSRLIARTMRLTLPVRENTGARDVQECAQNFPSLWTDWQVQDELTRSLTRDFDSTFLSRKVYASLNNAFDLEALDLFSCTSTMQAPLCKKQQWSRPWSRMSLGWKLMARNLFADWQNKEKNRYVSDPSHQR